jgi:hypothetical protein
MTDNQERYRFPANIFTVQHVSSQTFASDPPSIEAEVNGQMVKLVRYIEEVPTNIPKEGALEFIQKHTRKHVEVLIQDASGQYEKQIAQKSDVILYGVNGKPHYVLSRQMLDFLVARRFLLEHPSES